jgi:hypothetical protein
MLATVLHGTAVVARLCALVLGGYQVVHGQWPGTPVLAGSMRPGL